jgi:hypothetical protein
MLMKSIVLALFWCFWFYQIISGKTFSRSLRVSTTREGDAAGFWGKIVILGCFLALCSILLVLDALQMRGAGN